MKTGTGSGGENDFSVAHDTPDCATSITSRANAVYGDARAVREPPLSLC
jgi:hypothetical protein